jgi:hypothetical protein
MIVLESRFKSSGHQGQKKHDGLFHRDHAFYRRWDSFVAKNSDILRNAGRKGRKGCGQALNRPNAEEEDSGSDEEEEVDNPSSWDGLEYDDE